MSHDAYTGAGRLTATARFMIRHRRIVIAVWLVALAISAVAIVSLFDLLTNRYSVPGSDANRAERILEEDFNVRSDGSFTVVYRARDGAAGGITAEAERGLPVYLLSNVKEDAPQLARSIPTGRVAGITNIDERTVSLVIATELDLVGAKKHTEDLRGLVRSLTSNYVGEVDTYVTGTAAITRDIEPVMTEDLAKSELAVALPIALVIVIWVFGSAAFLLPFLLAGVTIPVTLGVVWIFAHFMEISTFSQNLVVGIGLGISIDYSLLVFSRYREERRNFERQEAVERTMQSAGRAVLFSGTAVAIGLALLLLLPLPYMRGFGLAGLVIPLVSMLCSMTLVPVMIYLFADRLDAIRVVPKRVIERRRSEVSNGWITLARVIMARPWRFAILSTAILLVLAYPLKDMELTPGSDVGFPAEAESMQGLEIISDAVGRGVVDPIEVVVDSGKENGLADPAVAAATKRLIASFRGDPDVAQVVAGAPALVDSTQRYQRIQVASAHSYGDAKTQNLVKRSRDDTVPAAKFPRASEAIVGGGPALGVDFLASAYNAFPWLVLGVLLFTYVLLLRAFRSLLLPLKAIVLNVLSIGAAYGLVVAVFDYGWGSFLGLPTISQVEGWIPIFMFAMLFGLSMDYEVFLVSRMREEWDATGSNERAVGLGLAKTGRLVTAAGLIMVAAFGGFVLGSFAGIQQFGFGLAAAILIDVTLVRVLLLPAAMKLFGRWNWWLPEWAGKLFRVEPSPLHPLVVPDDLAARPSNQSPTAAG